MRNKYRGTGLLAGLAMLTALPSGSALAVVFTSDPLLGKANQLTERVHQFHREGPGYDAAFESAEPDYCRTMRKARWTLIELEAAYNSAMSAGNAAAARKYSRAADDLADELGEEDYLDWKWGEKDWCSPTAWDSLGPYDGPSVYTGFYVQPTVELGVASYRYNNFIDTTLPSSAFGGSSSTLGSYAFDLRAGIPVGPNWYAVFGGKLTKYFGDRAVRFSDLDAVSPGNDTKVSVQRNWSGTIYGGVAWKSPTLSAIMAGLASQVGGGTFLTTIWAGWRYDEYCGFVRTDELGIIRRTSFSASEPGFSFGVDVDYPLAGTVFDALWGPNRKAVVRAGFEYNNAGSFNVDHQAQFGLYRALVRPRDSIAARIGFGWQIYPNAGMAE